MSAKMKLLSSISWKKIDPSLSQNRCNVSQDRVTLEYITEGDYGISNLGGLQEKPGRVSVLEVSHFLGPNDCFRPLAIL